MNELIKEVEYLSRKLKSGYYTEDQATTVALAIKELEKIVNKELSITLSQQAAGREYIEGLEAAADDPTLPEETRIEYLQMWRGARRVLRHMNLQAIYSNI